ncbi:hypothetical protein O6P43_032569 [Quillaja saponaria]|uniref:Uncharacterized protein n=1 Tax=Quillaja saponaria TaxID=32244 RepID=A0AAD7KP08_QUISA|nr:hypothetical protein O6P43_032569 [Quillaja saponaria]
MTFLCGLLLRIILSTDEALVLRYGEGRNSGLPRFEVPNLVRARIKLDDSCLNGRGVTPIPVFNDVKRKEYISSYMDALVTVERLQDLNGLF